MHKNSGKAGDLLWHIHMHMLLNGFLWGLAYAVLVSDMFQAAFEALQGARKIHDLSSWLSEDHIFLVP
jgi:hypothetical protein